VSTAWSATHRAGVEVYAKAVRKELYHRWAQETTRQGVTLAKAGQYSEALKLYRQALEFDSTHRDAYVVCAHGAKRCQKPAVPTERTTRRRGGGWQQVLVAAPGMARW
jgi:predicted TPR repeat methyltransferase